MLGSGKPGGGVVGLGPGGRGRGTGLGRSEGIGGDGLGFGDHCRLVLGVGVEQRVDGVQDVDVVGQGHPRGGVVRFWRVR